MTAAALRGAPTWTTDLKLVDQAVPACLRDLPQWVCWKFVSRKGKWTKQPIDPKTGGPADSTDPQTWSTFDAACTAYQQGRGLSGVGFVFAVTDPYCGIDLDDCIDPGTATPKAWANQIITLLDSYTEVSPSRTGVKVVCRAIKPGSRCRKPYADGEVEVYDKGRFFVVTGLRVAQVSPEVEERQEQVEQLCWQVFEMKPKSSAQVPSHLGNGRVDDDEIIRIASQGRKNGAKFSGLWAGQWESLFRSPSEADASLVFQLAFFTKDAAQLDRLFRASGLMREKWNERHSGDGRTYGRKLIDNALETVTGQYHPKRPAAPPARAVFHSTGAPDQRLS